ncbi:MAG: HmuY family protein [Chitinophagaceae bacterium]|nr:HmuY family protein [Chitinophagaceae bacterium]
MRKIYLIPALLFMMLLIASCRKRDGLTADNYVVFETAAQGITAAETSITVRLKLAIHSTQEIPVTIDLAETGVQYGVDYSTSPAAVNGKIQLTVPSGSNEASFIVNKSNAVLFDGDEQLVFDINNAAAPVLIGVTRRFKLDFGEIVAANASLTINGGGTLYPNKVFVDLSANRQTVVNRNAWDLGFYTAAGEYRVILNSSAAMMAKQISKNDLNTVTAADTVGFSTDVAFNQFAPITGSLPYIDYPSGDLNRTAIAAVSAIAEDNKVFIVNRGLAPGSPAASRGWKKIRILRNASGGYTLQQADISASSFTTIDIAKDDQFFFRYLSFESGIVNVEPTKKKWDLAWTYFSNVTNFGSGEVPYLFQDILLINRNVQIARVMNTAKSFADFTEADIASQTFLSTQNAFAADWRSGGGPTTSPAVRSDRYYIIKDGDNNYYKLRFTALTQNGERGYPAFESVLVKKG